MKSSYFQNYLAVSFIFAAIISALFAHIGIVWLAIAIGFVVTMVGTRFVCKKWWNGELASQITPWKKWLIVALFTLVGSQFGWVALLI